MLDDPRIEPLIAKLPGPFPRWVAWLRQPSARWVRIPVALLFLCGGFLWFLPIVGFWMLPLGLLLLAQDIPLMRRLCGRLLDWIERRHPTWMAK